MIRNRKLFAFFLALTVLWMGVIFWKSGEPYQQQDMKPWLHSLVSEETVGSLLPPLSFTYDGQFVTHEKPYAFVEFFVRKGGHVAEFFILAALLWFTLKQTALPWLQAAALAYVLSVLYAASDEWHQTFVPHRTGHAVDVWVDALGATLALLLFVRRPRAGKTKNSLVR